MKNTAEHHVNLFSFLAVCINININISLYCGREGALYVEGMTMDRKHAWRKY